MKKITLLAAFLVASLGYSQELPFNFEDGANPFEANASIPSIITDPTDANNKVLQVEGKTAAYDNVKSKALTKFIDLSDNANNTITFRFKPVNGSGSGTHLLKFEGGVNGPGAVELPFTSTGTDWQDISLDFGAGLGSFGTIVIFTDFNNSSTDFYLIDDIQGAKNTDLPAFLTPPTTAPPTPPSRAAADVASIFSDAYTDISVITYDTSWCGASTVDITAADNPIKRVSNLGCEGIDFSGDRINANNFTHVHIDVFTNTATADKSFNLKFSNWNGGSGEANAIEFSTTNASSPTLPNTNPGTWISLDIPLSSWDGYSASDATKQNDLAQFIITSDLGTVFYDNVYFYKEGTASIEDELLASVNLFPNPVNNGVDLRISAKEKIQNAKIYNVIGKEVMSIAINNTSKDIDVSSLNTGVYLIKYTINNTVGTSKFIKQ